MLDRGSAETGRALSPKVLVTLFASAMLAVSSSATAREPVRASTDRPYSGEKSEPVRHQVDFSVVVTPPYHCRVLKVWIPVPQSDEGQRVGESRFTTYPVSVEPRVETEPVYRNRFAYFEFHEPQGAQVIRHRFEATVWNMNWRLNPESVVDVRDWPASFAPYLRPQPIADEKSFQEILHGIVPGRRGDGTDLTLVMDWIDRNMTYDHADASLSGDANHALARRRGHCSDYHGLCATMGRALGYPTRVTYGLALFPKNSPSHCKMEAYLPPHGWVSFDLSETQKMIKKIGADEALSERKKRTLIAAARNRLRSGFRENSWLLLTRGTGYELAPKASCPVGVVRTAYVEADGEPLPEPDPANVEKREYAWMTVHKYDADRPFKFPFQDLTTLEAD